MCASDSSFSTRRAKHQKASVSGAVGSQPTAHFVFAESRLKVKVSYLNHGERNQVETVRTVKERKVQKVPKEVSEKF